MDCRAELCPYWPGEGCLSGVMPCADVACVICGAKGDLALVVENGAHICADEDACRERMGNWQPTGILGLMSPGR